ncbi:MAG: sigma-70 family RNA polymerase sigma factor [Armatimonadetes bacterium]|nr:sigma-70 family RNA polymerase sigma factor [Armatimonadota bacterium]
MRTEDCELARQALAGKPSAFAELVDRYRDAVCAVAYHYLGSFEDTQDAAQEAFVQAYLHLKRLCDPERFAPWLKRIAANTSADFLRRRGDTLLSWDALPESAKPCRNPSPDEDMDRVAARMLVREALDRLSDKTRLTVTLFYIDGYSHAEIAGFLEVPVETVRSRLKRAKKQLQEEMITMVTDVLQEEKAEPEFTKDVVKEAMRLGEEARRYLAMDKAVEHYDEALTAIEKLEPSTENLRLKMRALACKGLSREKKTTSPFQAWA